jgi:tetratricopeptide (TPR) repeat protein
MALKHLCYGEVKEAKPMLDETVSSARSIGCKPALAAGLVWRACLYFFQTEYERAIECATEGRQLASELRDGFLLLTAFFFIGLSRGNLGRMSEALSTLTEAINMARRNGDLFWYPRMPNCIGWIHRELEDFQGAFEYDRDGLEISREHGVLEAQANSLINLGIDYSHSGKSDETISAFDEVENIFKRDAWFRWRYNIRLQAATARHRLQQGDFAKAREFAQQLQSMAEQYGVHKYIAVSYKIMAEIDIEANELAAAQMNLMKALEKLSNYPVPVVTWRIYSDLSELRSRTGDTAGASAASAEAARIIQQIAASVTDENLRSNFLSSEAVRNATARANAASRESTTAN